MVGKMLKYIFLFLCSVQWLKCEKSFEYQLKVKTSDSPFSGTDETVGFRLLGDKKNTDWLFVDGHKLNGINPFEMRSTDEVTIKSKDIGRLLDVEVQVVKQGFYLDKWKLNFIELEVEGIHYKAYFWKIFCLNKDVVPAKSIDIVECPDGFENNKVKRTRKSKFNHICSDIDECKSYCKGDGTICQNIPGSFRCFCNDGYKLDGDTCVDVNECLDNSRCYSDPQTDCINTVGSYECRCKNGFKKFQDQSTGSSEKCRDINECEEGKSFCKHNCTNTNGSYVCACERGYRLAPDGFSCIDADDCKREANPCDPISSECFDGRGGYRCLCKHGYKPGSDPNKCEKVTCQAVSLHAPHLKVSPSGCLVNHLMKKGERCTFSCKEGFELHENSAKSAVCSKSGFWENEQREGSSLRSFEPSCVPTRCEKLKQLKDGFVVPQSCIQSGAPHGMACNFYCKNGYTLEGQSSVRCNNKKFIPGKEQMKGPTCHKIPTIECPSDITISLPRDRSTAHLGMNYRGPSTNMNKDQVYSVPKNISGNYEFSVGDHVIRMIAKNDLGHRATCSYIVTVKDTTPPIVKFCPDTVYFRVKGQRNVFVNWTEPEFVDNVAITKRWCSQENNKLRSPTSFNVVCDAIDASGNAASCLFTVRIDVMTCSFDMIEGGDQSTRKQCTNMPQRSLCLIDCPPGKTLSEVPKGKMLKNSFFCTQGVFYHSNPKESLSRLPDCVDYDKISGNKCPPGYTKTLVYNTYADVTVCGKCPRGTRYLVDINHPEGVCVDCPEHHYQDEEGQTYCKKCPEGSGNVKSRMIGVEECKALCPPGTYSRTGFPQKSSSSDNGCFPCSRNTYSHMYGAVGACTQCPPGKITEDEGSNDVSHCIDIPIDISLLPARNIVVKEGETVKFRCISVSEIQSTLAWYPPCRLIISPGTSHEVRATESPETRNAVVQEYVITNAQITDSGAYTCQVTNKFGSLRILRTTVTVQKPL